MSVASLLEGVRGYGVGALGWAVHHSGVLALVLLILAIPAAGVIYRRHRRNRAIARAVRLQWGIHDLKERLRTQLAEPVGPFADGIEGAPTMGACQAFEADIEAAAKNVLIEAGGRRGKAKHILRQRLNGHGAEALNGSEAAYWRQLGALSLLDSTSDALKAYARAAELSPDDLQAQMLLGVLCLRTGRLEKAEAVFRHLIKLAANGGSEMLRYRAGTMLGDVLAARGDRPAARAAYEAAQREAEALAQREPENSVVRRDLSVTHDRIGDMLIEEGQLDSALERYRCSLAIAERLAKEQPADLGRKRDLSIAHDRIGDVLDRKGDVDGALKSFRAGLAIAEIIAAGDPDRPEWRWDVSASLDRIGDLLVAKAKPAQALAAYRRGLALAEETAGAEPGRTGWQRDLAVTYHKIGSLEALQGNEGEARELLERGRAIIARLDRIAAHQAQWRADLSKFDQAINGLGP